MALKKDLKDTDKSYGMTTLTKSGIKISELSDNLIQAEPNNSGVIIQNFLLTPKLIAGFEYQQRNSGSLTIYTSLDFILESSIQQHTKDKIRDFHLVKNFSNMHEYSPATKDALNYFALGVSEKFMYPESSYGLMLTPEDIIMIYKPLITKIWQYVEDKKTKI